MSIRYTFHHLGIPTEQIFPEAQYSEVFDMYTSDHTGNFRIQFHRFGARSPLHELIRTQPHIALQVDDLEEATAGMEIILGPYEPVPDYKVAIINDAGMPVELIETSLSDEELWTRSRKQRDLNTKGLNLSED